MTGRRIAGMMATGLVGGTVAGMLVTVVTVVAVVAALTLGSFVPVRAAGYGGGSPVGVGLTRDGGAVNAEITAGGGFATDQDETSSPGHSSGGDKKQWRGEAPDEPGGQAQEAEDEVGLGDDAQNKSGDDDDEAVEEEPGKGDAESDREQDRKQDRDQNRDRERDREQDREQNQDQDQNRDKEQHREQAELSKQLRLKLDFEAGLPPGQQEEKPRGQVGIVSLAHGEEEITVKLEMNLAAQLHSSLQFALNHGYEYEWAVQVLQQVQLNLAAGADARLIVEIIAEGVRKGVDPAEILARLRVEAGALQPTGPGDPTQPPAAN